jgi:hypothetical protein
MIDLLDRLRGSRPFDTGSPAKVTPTIATV